MSWLHKEKLRIGSPLFVAALLALSAVAAVVEAVSAAPTEAERRAVLAAAATAVAVECY